MVGRTTTHPYTTIELLTPNGPEFRRVSTAAPRQPTGDEIPLICLADIDGHPEGRRAIAANVRKAAENTGFFYVYDHGISEGLIDEALLHTKAFFEQSPEKKNELGRELVGAGVGYRGPSETQINRTETRGRLLATKSTSHVR